MDFKQCIISQDWFNYCMYFRCIFAWSHATLCTWLSTTLSSVYAMTGKVGLKLLIKQLQCYWIVQFKIYCGITQAVECSTKSFIHSKFIRWFFYLYIQNCFVKISHQVLVRTSEEKSFLNSSVSKGRKLTSNSVCYWAVCSSAYGLTQMVECSAKWKLSYNISIQS